MNDFETFQKLRKQHQLTHAATAKLLRISRASINKWVTTKQLPKWPLLLLERKLSIDIELSKISSPYNYLKAFYDANTLTRKQIAAIIGISADRLNQWFIELSPTPLWAVESLILGVLFDKKVIEELAQIHFLQVRKSLRY